MDKFKKLNISEICGIITSARSAFIICHVNPDGDTLGCALAMREIFTMLGKKSKIACPSAPPRCLGFLTGGDSFEYTEHDEEEYDLILSADVASPGQLGALVALKDKIDLMIDHHSGGEAFADNYIDCEAAAAGEIIFRIYEQLCGASYITPSPDVCRYLYAALSSDTGSFKYSNTTPETMRIAASLMEEVNRGGMSTDEISRLLHDTVSKTDMAVAAAVSSSLFFFEDSSLAVTLITAADMERGGFSEGDLGGAVDIPRKIENVLVAVALKQRANSPGSFRLSARANCDIDVSDICGRFGGGGHARAAGASISADSPEEALKITAAAFSPAVAEYKKSRSEKRREDVVS